MNKIENFYDKLYSKNNNVFGSQHNRFLDNILNYLKTGTVLDLGAGEGRNSLFLAEQGFKVTAIDISSVAIEKVKKLAAERNLQIETQVADIAEVVFDNDFDLIICIHILHHLSAEDAVGLINKMKSATKQNGLNLIVAFTKDGDFFQDDPTTPNFFLGQDELKEFYKDWEILRYEEHAGPAAAKNPDGSPMINTSANIISRKC